MDKRQRIRPQCPQCGSRKFRRDADTSLVVCAYGHVLQNYRQEETDAGEEYSANASQSQRRRRYIRRQRNVRARTLHQGRVNVHEWKGQRGHFHYLQCLQLILRHQIVALREAYPALPQQLETVCKELWTYYVSLFDHVRAPPFSDEEEPESVPSQTLSRSSSLARASRADLDAIMEEEQYESDAFDQTLRDMQLVEEEQQDQRGRHESRSSADADSDASSEYVGTSRRSASLSTSRSGAIPVYDTVFGLNTLLSIVYLSLVYLRVPIMWTDIRSLIFENRLPYVNAIYVLPTQMSKRLTFYRALQLEAGRAPDVYKLHRRTVRLADKLNEAFDVAFPPLNVLPLLWRCTERLLLPSSFYRAAKRLLAYLDMPCSSVSALAAAEYEHREGDVEYRVWRRNRARSKPRFESDKRLIVSRDSRFSVAREVVLISALVLMAKLRYGLDGEAREEDAERSDFWSGAPPLHPWLQTLDEARGSLAHSDVRRIGDPSYGHDGFDLLDMNDEDVDKYLDFAERSLLLDNHPIVLRNRDRRAAVADYLTAVTPDVGGALNDDGHPSSIRATQPASSVEHYAAKLYDGDHSVAPTHLDDLPFDTLRPGEAHSVYNRTGRKLISPADASEVHPSYARLLRHASRIVDCKVEEVSDTVHSLEAQLIKKLTERRESRLRRSSQQNEPET